MEIDLSSLSENQKKFYVELLAQSNLQFIKKNNQFVAQFKVDSSQVGSSMHQHLLSDGKSQVSSKSNHSKNDKREPQKIMNRKKLSRVVKVGDLGKFQTLHPNVEVYIYPKKMTAWTLQEMIEGFYDKFWQEHKRKSNNIRQLCFVEWVYNQIAKLREKLKIQQFLVNLIDSVYHYQQKMEGVRIFNNFIAEKWPVDALFYFLVLRGMLEQITGERILDKASNAQGMQAILGYKLRSNPHQKSITQEDVLSFLHVLQGEGLFCSKNKSKTFEHIFEQLTNLMYFDQSRKKNYINFYELLQYLVVEFLDTEVSSCQMSLSKTEIANDEESISELISYDISQEGGKSQRKKDREREVSVDIGLDPVDEQTFREREQMQEPRNLGQQFETMVIDRANEMYYQLGTSMSERTLDGLMAGVRAIVTLDKSRWLTFRGEVTDAQLLSLERLQAKFREYVNPVLLTKLVKDFFLIPVIRQLMLKDISL